MREYIVQCSNMRATYTAGTYVADSPEEAKRLAREDYRKSAIGRALSDVGAFRFWVSSPVPSQGGTS